MIQLDAKSEAKLKGVHPDLVRVVRRAAMMSDTPFAVICGVRSVEEQRAMVKRGVSKTMNSRHIPAANGFSHAVDIVPVVNGKQEHSEWRPFFPLAKTIKAAAKAEKVKIEWGGDWTSIKDGPHWQLPWKAYPALANVNVRQEKPITDRTEQQAATRRAATTAASGAVTGGALASEPIVAVATAVTDQQEGLTSGQWIRIGVAVVVIAVAVFVAWRQLRAPDEAAA